MKSTKTVKSSLVRNKPDSVAKNVAKACVKCGHPIGAPALTRLGRSAAEDVKFVAVESSKRFATGDVRAMRTTAILDALWLTLRRSDDQALERLNRVALEYLKTRRPSERWGKHEAWSGNASTVRALVQSAEEHLKLEADTPGAAEGFAWTLAALFPQVVSMLEEDWSELKRSVSELASALPDDPQLFAERALVAAGMSRKDAHQRFAVLRVSKSRSDRKRIQAGRKRRPAV